MHLFRQWEEGWHFYVQILFQFHWKEYCFRKHRKQTGLSSGSCEQFILQNRAIMDSSPFWMNFFIFIFDRSLVEAVQGIALSGDFCVQFAQIRDIFSLFCHVFIKTSLDKSLSIMTCLDMFENRIKLHHKHYDMSGHVWESHQIPSKVLWHVRTGLKIISNCIMTCLDMFVESYQIVSEYF